MLRGSPNVAIIGPTKTAERAHLSHHGVVQREIGARVVAMESGSQQHRLQPRKNRNQAVAPSMLGTPTEHVHRNQNGVGKAYQIVGVAVESTSPVLGHQPGYQPETQPNHQPGHQPDHQPDRQLSPQPDHQLSPQLLCGSNHPPSSTTPTASSSRQKCFLMALFLISSPTSSRHRLLLPFIARGALTNPCGTVLHTTTNHS